MEKIIQKESQKRKSFRGQKRIKIGINKLSRKKPKDNRLKKKRKKLKDFKLHVLVIT